MQLSGDIKLRMKFIRRLPIIPLFADEFSTLNIIIINNQHTGKVNDLSD